MSKTIDKKMVAQIARLARIAVSDEELAALAAELDPILDWVGQLEEVDSSGVEPLATTASSAARAQETGAHMREDIPASPISVERALGNAPESQSGFFITPKTNA